MSAKVSPKPSPRPSPRLWRSHSYGSRRNSWKFKRTKDGQGDRAKLVDTIPNNTDYDDDDGMYDYDDDDDDDEVFKPYSQPMLKQRCGSSIKRYIILTVQYTSMIIYQSTIRMHTLQHLLKQLFRQSQTVVNQYVNCGSLLL